MISSLQPFMNMQVSGSSSSIASWIHFLILLIMFYYLKLEKPTRRVEMENLKAEQEYHKPTPSWVF
jgi:hypothetical protein